jgi:nicotinamidase-related amidase
MTLTTLDARSALVVIDLQQGIAAMSTVPHAAGDVIERSTALADAFRAHQLPVVRVRVSFAPDFADAMPGRTELAARGAAGMPEGWDLLVDERPTRRRKRTATASSGSSRGWARPAPLRRSSTCWVRPATSGPTERTERCRPGR